MIAKNPKVIMTNKEIISRAKILAKRRTFYKNKYPYNLCYIHNDGRTSADCVNLYKALFNGYDVNNTTKGYYQRDLSNTGDCTEAELLAQCTDVDADFSSMVQTTDFHILYMRGHIGGYIGTYYYNENYYNVVECTGSWGGGILFSWIDPDGTRRRMKGGSKNGKWAYKGKPTKWVSYDSQKPQTDPSVPADDKNTDYEYYTVKSGDILSKIATKFNTTVDELMKLNPQIKDKNLIYAGQKIRVKEVNEVYHTVKKGEVLSVIAQKYNTTVDKIMALNPTIKDKNKIYVGQKIRVR